MKGNVIRLLVSLLLAFAIWVYVVTVVSPESEDTFYNIPVALSNASILSDRGFMLTSEDTPTVTLRLKGNRSDLNSLKNSDISVVADLSKINEEGEQALNYTVTFTGNGSNNLYEIVSSYPETVMVSVTEWDTKVVPVKIRYTGMLGTDYIALKDDISVDTSEVTLTGPKSVVDQITQAVIDIDLDDRVETVNESYRYTLCDGAGEPVDAAAIKTNVGEIGVVLKIQRVKEIQLKLDVTYGGGATADNTDILMDYISIKVTGSEKLLENFNSITLGSVNLANVAEDTQLIFPIKLLDGITNLTGVDEITVDISFRDLVTKELDVSSFFVKNLPSGMTYELITKTKTVTIRGTQEQIQQIEAEDVSLMIDLKDAELGEDSYKAQIMLPDTFDDVGAVGNYTVYVTLLEKTDSED